MQLANALEDTTTIPTTSPTAQSLADKSFCLVLKFGRLGNRKKLKSSQYTVEADKSMTDANMKLLDAPELKAIEKADNAFKSSIDAICAPFPGIKGGRLLRKNVSAFVLKKCAEYADNVRPMLIDAFLDVMEARRQEAEKRLGKLYDPANYLSQAQARAEFEFSFSIEKFGATPEGLQDYAPEMYERQVAEKVQFFEDAGQKILMALRSEFLESVVQMRDQLSDEKTPTGKRRKVYESTLNNLREFAANWNLRNMMDDDRLTRLVEQADAVLQGKSVESLKDTDGVRAQVRSAMTEISTKLDELVSTPVRVFLDDED